MSIMKFLPRFTPVIHVTSPEQAIEQYEVVRNFGGPGVGVFLIAHRMKGQGLANIVASVRAHHRAGWIGVNFLDFGFKAASTAAQELQVDALWIDNADDINVPSFYARFPKREWRLFAGASFKYQPAVVDDANEARRVAEVLTEHDVVTTSGPGTSEAASVEKVEIMARALGVRPLALASGVTVDNIEGYLPYVSTFLVATGVSKSFDQLDPVLVSAMADKINAHVS